MGPIRPPESRKAQSYAPANSTHGRHPVFPEVDHPGSGTREAGDTVVVLARKRGRQTGPPLTEDVDMNAEPIARRRNKPETLERNRQAGQWLKQKREAAGLTQRDLAILLDIDYYTFISQLETGRGRIPSRLYADWAKALRIDPSEFVKHLLRFYDPATYKVFFGNEESGGLNPVPEDDPENGRA